MAVSADTELIRVMAHEPGLMRFIAPRVAPNWIDGDPEAYVYFRCWMLYAQRGTLDAGLMRGACESWRDIQSWFVGCELEADRMSYAAKLEQRGPDGLPVLVDSLIKTIQRRLIDAGKPRGNVTLDSLAARNAALLERHKRRP